MRTCRWVRAKLVGFLLGELPARHLRAVAAHAGRCPGCLQELVALRRAVAALGLQEGPAHLLPPLTPEEKTRLRRLVRAGRQRPLRLALTCAAAALLVLALLVAPSSPPRRVATVVVSTGRPEYRLAGQAWLPLRRNAEVPVGATLRTGDVDLVQVQFDDGSRASLDFDTEVCLDTRSERRAVARADLQLTRGRVWLLVTPAQTGLRVRTEAGSAEALGTIFEVATRTVEEGAAAASSPDAVVTVVRGKVRVSNAHGSVEAGTGTTTAAHLDRKPDPPRPVSYVSTVRRRVPWEQAQFEVWLMPGLGPDELARRLVGRRGWSGLETAAGAISLSGRALPGSGLTILRVTEGSPAAQAGCVPGDRLLQVGETQLRARSDLWRAELQYLPGARVPLAFRHAGRVRRCEVTLREPPFARETHPEARLEEANREAAGGSLTRAAGQYAALTESPAAASAFHNLGVLAEARGDVAAAEGYYRQAVEHDGLDPRFRYSLALALVRLGNFGAALRELEASLDREPHNAEARLQFGSLLGVLGQFERAQEQVERLSSDAETRAQGFCLAGELARLREDLAGAQRAFEQARRLAPLSADPPTYLGAVHYLRGEMEEASEETRRALVLDPNSVRAWNRLGLIHCRQAQYEDALAALGEAARLQPGDAAVYTNLGLTYYGGGDAARAAQAYAKAVLAAPDSIYPRLGLAAAYEGNHQPREAEAQYARVLELDPTCGEAYVRLASLYRQRGQVRLAQETTERSHKYGL